MVSHDLPDCALDGEERAGCFTLFVFLMSCDFYVALPQDTVDWYVVSDCRPRGNSVAYSTFVYQLICLRV